jgi:hypothetical protein
MNYLIKFNIILNLYRAIQKFNKSSVVPLQNMIDSDMNFIIFAINDSYATSLIAYDIYIEFSF